MSLSTEIDSFRSWRQLWDLPSWRASQEQSWEPVQARLQSYTVLTFLEVSPTEHNKMYFWVDMQKIESPSQFSVPSIGKK